jgi:hypothetical protein
MLLSSRSAALNASQCPLTLSSITATILSYRVLTLLRRFEQRIYESPALP